MCLVADQLEPAPINNTTTIIPIVLPKTTIILKAPSTQPKWDAISKNAKTAPRGPPSVSPTGSRSLSTHWATV